MPLIKKPLLKRKIRRPAGPPKIVVCSPNTKSNALKALANKLGEKLGYRVYRVTPDRVKRRIPVHFHNGVDKVEQFQRFREGKLSAPKHCLEPSGIADFSFKRVVARTLTNSSEGRGIVVFEKGETPPRAPLYTEYIPKKKEFRVHVWNNEVIDVVEKRKRRNHSGERDDYVRNTANGYVFCRDNIIEPADIRDLALGAVRAINRTYGAVDIVWTEKLNKCFVLEVNSRPGMEGTTVEKYANAILKGLGK